MYTVESGTPVKKCKSYKCKNCIEYARTYLQLPLRQWGAGNVYLLVLSSWKVNIAENHVAVMGYIMTLQMVVITQIFQNLKECIVVLLGMASK